MNKIAEAILIEKAAQGTTDFSEYRKAQAARGPEEESKAMGKASKTKTTARLIGLGLGAGLALITKKPTESVKKLILPSLFGGFIGGQVGERLGARKYNKDLGFSVTRRPFHPIKPLKVKKIEA